MTPLELLALICIFAVVRVAISIKPAPVLVGEGASPSARTVIREYLDAFIVAGLVALFLITFVVRTFYIPSGSMIPTLEIHDVLLVNEFEYRFAKPAREDIVVFDNPGGQAGLAVVPEGMEEATEEAAEECPGECIFIEKDDA